MSLLRFLAMSLATGAASALGAADLVSLAQKGDPEAVLRSIADGVKPDEENSKGHLPLVAAGMLRHYLSACAPRRMQRSEDQRPRAVQKGDRATTAALLQSHASPVAVERASSQSALTAAFAAGNSKLASLLLSYGASPDEKDKLGKTARSLAEKSRGMESLIETWDAEGAAGFEAC